MAHLILIIIGTLAFGGVCFWMGRRSRALPPLSASRAEAIRYVLTWSIAQDRKNLKKKRAELQKLNDWIRAKGEKPDGHKSNS